MIAKRWADDLIESWQPEYGAWDDLAEREDLTDEELEYLMYSVRYAVVVK
jgi:hypothetical protein